MHSFHLDDAGSDDGWEDADGDAGWGNDDDDGDWGDEGIEGVSCVWIVGVSRWPD